MFAKHFIDGWQVVFIQTWKSNESKKKNQAVITNQARTTNVKEITVIDGLHTPMKLLVNSSKRAVIDLRNCRELLILASIFKVPIAVSSFTKNYNNQAEMDPCSRDN